VTKTPEEISSVRAARFQLAAALHAERLRSDEAIEQMWKVLDDRGTEPSDAIIYATLLEMYEGRGDTFGALKVAVLAVSRNPVENESTADHALLILDRVPGIAGDLPDDVVHRLEEAVMSATGAWRARLLAGRLSLERGEFDKANALLQEIPAGRSAPALIRVAEAKLALGKADEALQSLLAAQAGLGWWQFFARIAGQQNLLDRDRFQLLLARAQAETGHYAEALELVPEARTAEHAFVRALACVGQNRLDDARAACANQSSLDILLLRTIIHLQGGHFDEARTEIVTASSQNPSSPDVLLVRAQVELESAGNLEEGRALLQRLFETIKQDLLRTRWLTLQKPFELKRERFQYFVVEAADVSGDEKTIELARAVERVKTEYSQDGRLDSILGDWLGRKNDPAGAAKALHSASENFEKAGLVAAALTAAQRAFERNPNGRIAARLTRLRWRITFSDMSPQERSDHLSEAKKIFATNTFPEESGDTDELLYYAGLVAAREADLVERDRQLLWWSAAVNFFAAVLNSEKDSYRARFLAEALRNAGANGAAVVFANRALEWYVDDSTREEAVVSRTNYYPGLDRVDELLGQFKDVNNYGAWVEVVRTAVRLDSGQLTQMAARGAESPVDQPWARFVYARAAALFNGVSEAQPLLTRLAEEFSSQQGGESDGALTRLFLGRIDDALRCIREGEELRNDAPTSLAWVRALIDLARKTNDDLSVAVTCATQLPPIRVSAAFYVDLPILQKVYAAAPFGEIVGQLLNRLADVVRAPVQEPTMYDGLQLAPDQYRNLLQAMAQVYGSLESGVDVPPAIERLSTFSPGGRLQTVLSAVSARALANRETLGA